MTYVAYLRVRHRLVVFLAIVLAFVALNTAGMIFGHGYHGSSGWAIGWSSDRATDPSGADMARRMLAGMKLPLAGGFAIATAFALFFATFATASLNGMRDSLHLAFARPIGRATLALRFFAVDAAALGSCFLAICIVVAFELAIVRSIGRVYVDAAALPTLVFGFGIAFMYYGLMQAVTAWQRRSTGALVGGLWAVFFVALPLHATPFGPVFQALVDAVRFVDPLVYYDALLEAIGRPDALAAVAPATVLVWAIGVAGCAIALLSWKRLEV